MRTPIRLLALFGVATIAGVVSWLGVVREHVPADDWPVLLVAAFAVVLVVRPLIFGTDKISGSEKRRT